MMILLAKKLGVSVEDVPEAVEWVISNGEAGIHFHSTLKKEKDGHKNV